MSDSSRDEPLGLTIQTLPGQSAASAGATRTKSGRWMMVLVMLACFSPVIASYLTFYVFKPTGGNSYGHINTPLGPQYEMPAVQAVDLHGKALDLRSLKGQWLLLSVSSGACPEVCQKHLYLQRQLREMLGAEKDRVDWVWLIGDEAAIPADLQAAAAQAQTLRVPQAKISAWLKPEAGHAVQDHLYLIDPMGNWMMRFPADLEPKKAFRDISRLLRASNSWDRAGRGVVYE
jgi:cytochrome oxidase Cu insertion factor (SCO1/SenC/PrrC family)